ncbi:MAG: hypothetical protein CEN92_289 [Candidatus Berkelbacteria bacterium Licking1014_96]|uniref:Uncharacterized protein n=1 Tax=Candidatus Berkelbacteria bacterium Licking1014_96 TaxID=2017149 RepID=A0A554LEX1_9BACT|nr:MAG: hypothetical protein CEN92_289 [Candidatus Berkelbacteria bacterium Licking1014_96]
MATHSNGKRTDEGWPELLDIKKDLGAKGALGITPDGNGVYIPAATRNYVAREYYGSEDAALPEGSRWLGQLILNNRPDSDQKYFCAHFHRQATAVEFDEAVEASMQDDLDKTETEICTTIATMFKRMSRQEIASSLLAENTDPLSPDFPKMIRVREKEQEEGFEQDARDVYAELLSKGELRGLLLTEAKARIEKGPEIYWGNGADSGRTHNPGKPSKTAQPEAVVAAE